MEKVKSFFSNYFLLSAISVLIGVFFIVKPDTIPNAISYIAGGVIIAVGVVEVGRFLTAGEGQGTPVWLVRGVILAAVGLFIILRPDFIYRVFSFVFGVYMLASGLLALYDAMRIKKHNGGQGWQIPCALAVITVVAGIVMLFNPLLPFVALGVILVVSGVTNLFGALTGKKKVEKLLGLSSGKDVGRDGGKKNDKQYIDVK